MTAELAGVGVVPGGAAVPAPPATADALFGTEYGRALTYANLLADVAVQRGLIGPREVPRLWDRHLMNCAVVAPALASAGEVVDLGSGAGLPGVVLALLLPQVQFTLVDATRRRVEFLDHVVEVLALSNVETRWARAEALSGSMRVDAVVARAVAPLSRLLGWALPLLRQDGELLALKGATAQDEVAAAASELRRLRAGVTAVETYGAGVVDPPATVIRVRRTRDRP